MVHVHASFYSIFKVYWTVDFHTQLRSVDPKKTFLPDGWSHIKLPIEAPLKITFYYGFLLAISYVWGYLKLNMKIYC
jgi:hypothetical protein